MNSYLSVVTKVEGEIVFEHDKQLWDPDDMHGWFWNKNEKCLKKGLFESSTEPCSFPTDYQTTLWEE